MNTDQLSNLLGFKARSPEAPASIRSNPLPVDLQQTYGSKKVILSWKALARPARKDAGKKVTRAIIVASAAAALILALLQEFPLILVIVSLAFVSYVLSKVPPEEALFEISSHGIKINDDLFYWHEMSQFFFVKTDDFDVLAVDVPQNTPTRLFLTIHNADMGKIKDVLSEHLNYIEVEPKSIFDRTYENFIGKFNI